MTIDEFAQQIGVSTTTVSRALSGRGRVSSGTRQMVRQRMEELGYRPNRPAQSLAAGRTQVIGLDWASHVAAPLMDAFQAQLISGVQQALQAKDFGLLLCGPRQSDMLQGWAQGGAMDGVVVLGGGPDDDATARSYSHMGIPCVVIAHRPILGLEQVSTVVLNLEPGIQEVARTITAAGHRRIGYLGSLNPDPAGISFAQALAALGNSLNPAFSAIVGPTVEDGERGMESLLNLPEPPTAVFARTDLLAAGALRAAHRKGLHVPDDIALVGHDDLPLATLVYPPLTTLRVDCLRLGEAAAELLLALIDEKPASTQRIPTQLILRESLQAPRLDSERTLL